MKIEVSGNAKENFQYTQNHLDKWLISAVGDKAHEYKSYAVGSFEQYLTNRTGETRGSIQAWIPKRNLKAKKAAWYIRPGVHIKGMLNYLFKWVGTDKDFMGGSFEQWSRNAQIDEYTAREIRKRFDKLKGTKK